MNWQLIIIRINHKTSVEQESYLWPICALTFPLEISKPGLWSTRQTINTTTPHVSPFRVISSQKSNFFDPWNKQTDLTEYERSSDLSWNPFQIKHCVSLVSVLNLSCCVDIWLAPIQVTVFLWLLCQNNELTVQHVGADICIY